MNKKKQTLLMVLGILGLIVITAGVTFAFFSYTKEGTTENTVTTGTITFLYTEIDQVGAGISLTNAFPISDSQGKALTGDNEVFDFKITSNTPTKTNIPYEITARKKQVENMLDEEAVRIYLTKNNGTEEEVLLDNYSNLTQTSKVSKDKYIEKTLHTDKVPANSTNYEQAYRLRMWVDEGIDFSPVKDENGNDTYPYNNKEFTVTVNVYANAKVVTQDEIDLENSTAISSIMVGNKEAIKVENKEYDYEIKLPEGTTETILDIETVSKFSTVSIEKIGDSLAYKSLNVKRLSTNNSVSVEGRYNYFKVTVISLDKQNKEEYILKVKVLKTYNNIDDVRNSFKETEKNDVLACEYNPEKETFIDCDYYNQLNDSYNKLNSYVVLENNISISEAMVEADNNIILDLNGYTINLDIWIRNYGDLTINDTKGTGRIISQGQVLNNPSSGTITVNGGYYERTSGTGAIIHNEETGTVIINDGEFVGNGAGIQNGTTTSVEGDIKINGGNFYSNGHTIYNFGDTNITGGIFSSKNGSAILNVSGTMNIIQTEKPIYTTTLTANDAQPIRNNGTMNIKANKANTCNSNASATTSGLCAYNGNTGTYGIAVGGYGTGTINIDGGTYYGINYGIVNVNYGILNIRNAMVTGKNKNGAQNSRGGTINICNSTVIGGTYDLVNAGVESGKGIVNYDKNTIFRNNSTTPVTRNNNGKITANYTGMCQ